MERFPVSDFIEYAVYKNRDIKILAREIGNDLYSIKVFYFYDDEDEDDIQIADEEHIVRKPALTRLFDHYHIPKASKETEWVFEETEDYVSL